MSETLWTLLCEQAARRPDKTAFVMLGSDLSERESVTYAQLCDRAAACARDLESQGLGGGRTVLFHPTSIDFIAALFGVLAAGGVAIPLNPRLRSRPSEGPSPVVAQAAPRAILGDDRRGVETADVHQLAAPEGTAVIQYTSGSTAEPKGVCVTHANLLANAAMLRDAFDGGPDDVAVCWLPFFHDMGLMSGVILPVVMGATSVLLQPSAFSARPALWLKALTRYGGTVSTAPNFAYQHCLDKISDADMAGLDLRSWRVAMCGAEPVRAATVEGFCERFAPAGFDRRSLIPSYGLAEATLFVSGGPRTGPKAVDNGGRTLVACGDVAGGQDVRIVDPERREVVAGGEAGEIWIRGPSVAAGYFNLPEESQATFGAHLAGGEGPYLRTGDLGMMAEGELVVTGRLKDVIIVRGTKHHPQDIELTCAQCHPALEGARGVAFAAEDADGEALVVVHELRRGAEGEAEEAAAAIRAAVAQGHGLIPGAVVLTPHRSLPLTSSGKVRRQPTRAAWLAGALPRLERVNAEAGA